MEINITKNVTQDTFIPWEMSNSVANMGRDAGRVTWENAKHQAEVEPLVLTTDEEKQAFRDYVQTFGAWDHDEIIGWDDVELRALFWQLVAGDIRDGFGDDLPTDPNEWNWIRYQKDSEAGRCSSRLFLSDDGELFYLIGE